MQSSESDDDALRARGDRLLGIGAGVSFDRPLHLVRGEGVWLFDAQGRRFLDGYNNVPAVGHANPRVVEALAAQSVKHQIHSRYLDEVILDYAEQLLDLHAPSLDRAVFCCTGTEANVVALMMARIATGGEGFIGTTAAYHGQGPALLKFAYTPRRGRRDVHAIPYPQRYRPIADGVSEEELTELYCDEVPAAIDDFAAKGVRLGGLLVCPVLANEGMPDLPAGFLAAAADVVRAAGSVVIFDEVQSGFGRTGTWWHYEQVGVAPDIVTSGKPMGNGYPLAACVAGASIVEPFRAATRYINTCAGSPVQGAVGMAVIAEMQERDLVRGAGIVGTHLEYGIREVVADCARIGEIRRRGLFLGLECVTDRETRSPDPASANAIVNSLKDRAVITGSTGEHGNVVKIRPPLVFEEEHAEVLLAALAPTIASLGDR